VVAGDPVLRLRGLWALWPVNQNIRKVFLLARVRLALVFRSTLSPSAAPEVAIRWRWWMSVVPAPTHVLEFLLRIVLLARRHATRPGNRLTEMHSLVFGGVAACKYGSVTGGNRSTCFRSNMLHWLPRHRSASKQEPRDLTLTRYMDVFRPA
jgi:hypothetical protein